MANPAVVKLTETGLAKATNALALGNQLTLTEVAFGDANGTPYVANGSESALVNEVHRVAISNTQSINSTQINIQAIVISSVAAFNILEAGVFDSAGDMIAIITFDAARPKSTLTDFSLTIPIVVASADQTINVLINHSQILATRSYVDERVQIGIETQLNFTVGSGGDYAELQEALLDIHQKYRPNLIATDTQVNLLVKSGYIITSANKVKLHNADLSWIKISTETSITADSSISTGSHKALDFISSRPPQLVDFELNLSASDAWGVHYQNCTGIKTQNLTIDGGLYPLFMNASSGSHLNYSATNTVGTSLRCDNVCRCWIDNANINSNDKAVSSFHGSDLAVASGSFTASTNDFFVHEGGKINLYNFTPISPNVAVNTLTSNGIISV